MCGTTYGAGLQWFCKHCKMPRINIPEFSELSELRKQDIIDDIVTWGQVTACCGALPEDCKCSLPVPLDEKTVNTHIGELAYDYYSDCFECIHYTSMSCPAYREFARLEAAGEHPTEIQTCDSFIWDSTSQFGSYAQTTKPRVI